MEPFMSPQKNIKLSVVAPAYNEEENIRSLIREIEDALKDFTDSYEIILVNDGSLEVCRELLRTHSCLRVLTLKARCGQTAGFDAGFQSASGQFISTIDADLQNDPADIPRLLKVLLEQKADLVNGWRRRRQDNQIRRISTKIANDVRNWLTHETIQDSACGLKVFRKECIQKLKLYTGMHRFLPTLFKIEGFTVIEVPVNHRLRIAGKAKYRVFNRLFRALRDTFAVRWMQKRSPAYQKEELFCDQ